MQQYTQQTQNFYKMNDNSLGTRTTVAARPKETNAKPHRQTNSQVSSVSQEMVCEASITAAYKLVEVENSFDVVKIYQDEVERVIKMHEHADCMLVIAREMHEACK